ncbi:MAG: leucine--tRNA ligase, partial [Patescibacteria group bacterium]
MRYNPQKIESKWQREWLEGQIYEPNLKKARKPFYNLMMFPYPSAEGLHVGNMYAFTGSDIYGRFKRMQGYDVFEPIGLDGFGIHSENYALKTGRHPADQAKISEKNFYRQLAMIGNGFAWDEKLETYNPEYYKWTQWIFTQMFKRGLAYRKKAAVNWCPSCKTVLADEQVVQKRQATSDKRQDTLGVCERCGTVVITKELEQWFFRITKYADRLLKNLEKIDWSEKIKIAQRNWIGRSEGSLIKFALSRTNADDTRTNAENLRRKSAFIEVFTTRPDTLFGATYMVLAPEHALISNLKSQISNPQEVSDYVKTAKVKTEEERIAEGREKTGVELKGIKAINPANQEEIPVWVADYVLGGVGTGAIMAVPAHDTRDYDFAQRYNLPIREVVAPQINADSHADKRGRNGISVNPRMDQRKSAFIEAYEGEGVLINSGKFNGMDSEKAKWEITKFVGGKRQVQYRLRDWLISRQRYWGPPIPMIYCAVCAAHADQRGTKRGLNADMAGWQPVPEKDLPVKLPYIKNFRPTGTDKSPLAADEKFYKVCCPKCGGWARRETDVSDTFLDSSWYYLGYLLKSQISNLKSQKSESKIGNWKLLARRSLGVGGEIGNSAFAKLMRQWLPVDMYIGGAEHAVLHLLYVRFLAMTFKDWGLVGFEEPFKKFRAHGLLIKEGAKMSKSKGNVINPDEYIKKYGADALRMYLMFLAPFESGGDFHDTGIRGITRFLERVHRLIFNFQFSIFKQNPKSEARNPKQIPNSKFQIQKILHRTIKKVTEDIEGLRYNTAISALMV